MESRFPKPINTIVGLEEKGIVNRSPSVALTLVRDFSESRCSFCTDLERTAEVDIDSRIQVKM